MNAMRFAMIALVGACCFALGSCAKGEGPEYDLTVAQGKMKAGDYAGAVEAYSRVIEKKPSASVYHDRGYARKLMGAYTEAIDDYTKAIELEPTNGSHFAGRGEAWGLMGDVEKACQDLTKGKELGHAKQDLIDKYCQ